MTCEELWYLKRQRTHPRIDSISQHHRSNRRNGSSVEAIPLHVPFSQSYTPENPSFSLYRYPVHLSWWRDYIKSPGYRQKMPRYGKGDGGSDRKDWAPWSRWPLWRQKALWWEGKASHHQARARDREN